MTPALWFNMKNTGPRVLILIFAFHIPMISSSCLVSSLLTYKMGRIIPVLPFPQGLCEIYMKIPKKLEGQHYLGHPVCSGHQKYSADSPGSRDGPHPWFKLPTYSRTGRIPGTDRGSWLGYLGDILLLCGNA